MNVPSTSSEVLGGRFRLERRLGQGGFGEVWDAVDLEEGSHVAVKRLPHLDAHHLESLKHEFRVVREITHPNLVGLYELFGDADTAWFTMELVDGVRFDEALRARLPDGEAAVASLVAQLLRAVAAIHEARAVHRDIKPANVLVDRLGRVVVLDFGLALTADDHETDIGGTLPFLAPEVLTGAIEPSVDWFAVGVLLYLSIVGELPWPEGAFLASGPPVGAAQALASRVGASLASVVLGLLELSPVRRLDGEQALGLLARQGPAVLRPARTLFGRDAELARIDVLVDRACAGELVVAHVQGPTGIGKSRVLREAVARHRVLPDLLVLEGRSGHAEWVPRRALDPLVRQLATATRRGVAPAPPPEDVAAIARVFSGFALLAPVDVDAPPPPARAAEVAPLDRRDEAVRALRAHLERASAARTLVLVLDDVQWADAESAELLVQLLTVPTPLRALLLVAGRDEEAAGPFLDALESWSEWRSRTVIPIGPLDPAAARSLVRALVHQEREDVVVAAAGHPLFLEQLARLPAGHAVQDPAEAVMARWAALPDAHRRLVELAAIAEGPLPRRVLLQASGVSTDALRALRDLEQQAYLRILPDERLVAPYHDLVRVAVRRSIPDDLRITLHASVADAWAATGRATPEDLFPHLLGAGRTTAAVAAAREAARRARASLAFDQEAAWLQQVAANLPVDDPERLDVLARAGAAWRDARRTGEAASAFRDAAVTAGLLGRSAEEQRGLWAETAEELVRGGGLAEGVAIFRRVLGEAGIRVPTSARVAQAIGLWKHLVSFVRGSRPTGRRTLTDDALEHLWKASNSLAGSDLALGFALGGMYADEALRTDLPLHRVRALGAEAPFLAALGPPSWRRHALRLLDEVVRELDAAEAATGFQPLLRLGRYGFTSATMWHLERWDDSVAAAETAAAIIRDHLPGHAWDLLWMGAYAGSSRFLAGRYREMLETVPVHLEFARDHDQWLAELHLALGEPGVVSLISGRPEHARAALERAWRRNPPAASAETYYGTTLEVRTALYEGRPADALAVLRARWGLLTEAQMLALRVPSILLHHLRALAALGAIDAGDRSLATWWQLRASHRHLRRVDTPMSRALAAQLDAARAERRGAVAEGAWRVAAEAAEGAGLGGYAWAARRRLDPDVVAPAGLADPERFARILAPPSR